MLDCLQDLTIDELVAGTSIEAPDGVVEDGEDSAGWMPIIDWFSRDPVLPHDYLTAMTNGFFNRVPIMTGKKQCLIQITYRDYIECIKSSFNLSETTHEEELQSRLIKKFYTGKNSNLLETLPDYASMMTDSLFLSPDQKVAELASQFVPVYNYRFTFSGRHSFLPFYLAGREAEFGEETAAAFNQLKNYMLLDVSASLEKEVETDRMAFWQKVHWNEREAKIEEVNIFKRAFLAVVKFFRGH